MNLYQRIWDQCGYGKRWAKIMRATVKVDRDIWKTSQAVARYTELRKQGACARVWQRMVNK